MVNSTDKISARIDPAEILSSDISPQKQFNDYLQKTVTLGNFTIQNEEFATQEA